MTDQSKVAQHLGLLNPEVRLTSITVHRDSGKEIKFRNVALYGKTVAVIDLERAMIMRETPSWPLRSWEVRAILEGRKTQARQLVRVRGDAPPPWATFAAEAETLTGELRSRPSGLFYWSEEQAPGEPLKPLRRWPVLPRKHPLAGDSYWTRCPYGAPGDRLWGRETFCAGRAVGGYAPGVDPDKDPDGPTIDVIYKADDEQQVAVWSPSRLMPRWASRITLEITNVRVQRLQDISWADAMDEGTMDWVSEQDTPTRHLPAEDARIAYQIMWDATRGRGSWDANPWVWVLTFRGVVPSDVEARQEDRPHG